AHVDDALEAEASADGRGGDSVLAGAGLGDDPLLAEPLGEERLAERVVQLVRARVEEILALQVEALARGKALGERERCRPARVGREQCVKLFAEGGIVPHLVPGHGQLVERRDQRLCPVAPAVLAVDADAHERTASTKALIRSWSLIPGESSSCELASTAHGRTTSIASRTFSGASRPARTMRPSSAEARAWCSGSSCSHGRSSTCATGSSPRRRMASRPRWPFSRLESWTGSAPASTRPPHT